MWKYTRWCLLAPDANAGGGSSSLPEAAKAVATAVADAKGASSSEAVESETAKTEGDSSSQVEDNSRAALDSKLSEIMKKHEAKTEEPEVEVEAETSEEAVEAEGSEEKDDSSEVPFHEHPRWKELQKQLAEAKPKAEKLDRIEAYCQQYGVTDDQVAQALEMAALLNNDPLAAYQKIQELSSQLSRYSGDKLPAELQKEVDEGNLTPAYAKQVAKLQAEVDLLKKKSEIGQQRSAVAARQQLTAAVNSWEQSTRSRDPDYDKKAELVEAQFSRLVQLEPPRNAEAAVALAEKAYSSVNRHLGSFVQAPARRAAPNGSSKKPLAQPKSALEVAQRVMAKFNR